MATKKQLEAEVTALRGEVYSFALTGAMSLLSADKTTCQQVGKLLLTCSVKEQVNEFLAGKLPDYLKLAGVKPACENCGAECEYDSAEYLTGRYGAVLCVDCSLERSAGLDDVRDGYDL